MGVIWPGREREDGRMKQKGNREEGVGGLSIREERDGEQDRI